MPILDGRRLAGLVRLGGKARPSVCCHVGTVVQLVGAAPTPHGALGGQRACAGYGQPVMSPRPHSRQKVVRRLGDLLAIRPPGDAVQMPRVEAVEFCQRSWR